MIRTILFALTLPFSVTAAFLLFAVILSVADGLIVHRVVAALKVFSLGLRRDSVPLQRCSLVPRPLVQRGYRSRSRCKLSCATRATLDGSRGQNPAPGMSRRLLIIAILEAAVSSKHRWSGDLLSLVNRVDPFSVLSQGFKQHGHTLVAA
jgi:hypothetical protein